MSMALSGSPDDDVMRGPRPRCTPAAPAPSGGSGPSGPPGSLFRAMFTKAKLVGWVRGIVWKNTFIFLWRSLIPREPDPKGA